MCDYDALFFSQKRAGALNMFSTYYSFESNEFFFIIFHYNEIFREISEPWFIREDEKRVRGGGGKHRRNKSKRSSRRPRLGI